MRFIDMHLHTTASDGSCTPSEVCQLAIDRNLAAIAITDHDTVDGVAESHMQITGIALFLRSRTVIPPTALAFLTAVTIISR
mgnify:CR=1 FL=1